MQPAGHKVERRDQMPAAWGIETPDGFVEVDDLADALTMEGRAMRRFSAAEFVQPDGTSVWSATYMPYRRGH